MVERYLLWCEYRSRLVRSGVGFCFGQEQQMEVHELVNLRDRACSREGRRIEIVRVSRG